MPEIWVNQESRPGNCPTDVGTIDQRRRSFMQYLDSIVDQRKPLQLCLLTIQQSVNDVNGDTRWTVQ